MVVTVLYICSKCLGDEQQAASLLSPPFHAIWIINIFLATNLNLRLSLFHHHQTSQPFHHSKTANPLPLTDSKPFPLHQQSTCLSNSSLKEKKKEEEEEKRAKKGSTQQQWSVPPPNDKNATKCPKENYLKRNSSVKEPTQTPFPIMP
jgi:hypothetical protein